MFKILHNTGTNLSLWINFVLYGITAFIAYRFCRSLYFLYQVVFLRNREREKEYIIKRTLINGVTLIAVIILFFFAFGPGDKIDTPPVEQDGMRRLTNTMPAGKTREAIKQDAEAKTPELLREVERQGAEKEQKDADDYIKKALERAEQRNRW